ncbi:Protein of unknown function DUF2515 [Caldalkalibacillus thermarum TA2.A1]|uniref:DUF2515 domain-containing protein n=1 Tax=Caldalkalibacillus thermarum (strain TA2.A1) TaxID=986075 RepID=F5L9W7_CALTT|nr:DUF2515 family protein [Caldalkalibacillus thermarum]EGL81837.1 Protein of unknown function DUF2515 [Caldalkalibacillus thermarum TA2.A1]QZT34327.1 DUF2515 domain-containing protein [Caldalkalibacillus thermarum TA2.A1]
MGRWWPEWREEIKRWLPFSQRTGEKELEERLVQLLSAPPFLPALNEEEEVLLNSIRGQTARYNRNNVTRTQAYLNLYLEHPEYVWMLNKLELFNNWFN